MRNLINPTKKYKTIPNLTLVNEFDDLILPGL